MNVIENFKLFAEQRKGAFTIPIKLMMAVAIVVIVILMVSFVAQGVTSQGKGALETLFNIDKWLGNAAGNS